MAVGKCLGHDGPHGELQQSHADIFHLRARGQLDEAPLVGVVAKKRRVEFIPHHPCRRHLRRQRPREEAECRELPRHRAIKPDSSRQVAAQRSGRGKRNHRQGRNVGGMGCNVGLVLISAGEQVGEVELAEIEITECGGAVVLQAHGGPILFGGGDAIPEDIGKLPADRRLQEPREFPLRVATAPGDPIVVHRDIRGNRIVGLVLDLLADGEIADHQHVGSLVVFNRVVEHFHMVSGQHHHARSLRHPRHDAPRVGKIEVVVVDDLVVKHTDILPLLHLQTGQIKHQQATGVVGRYVLVDLGRGGVFDFEAGHVAFGAAVAHHHAVRLPHIDSRIGSPIHRALFDQHIFTLHRIETIGAVIV